MSKYLGECENAREHFKIPPEVNCCNSCHEDNNEYGYELLSAETPAGWFYVCCSVSIAIDKLKESP